MLRWLRDKWKRDLVTLRERREKERRDRKILCPRCGYDVKILPDRPCPECGMFIDSRWRIGRLGAGAPLREVVCAITLYVAFMGFAPFVMLTIHVTLLLVLRTWAAEHGWQLAAMGLLGAAAAPVPIIGLRNWKRLLWGPKWLLCSYVAVVAILVPVIITLTDRLSGRDA